MNAIEMTFLAGAALFLTLFVANTIGTAQLDLITAAFQIETAPDAKFLKP